MISHWCSELVNMYEHTCMYTYTASYTCDGLFSIRDISRFVMSKSQITPSRMLHQLVAEVCGGPNFPRRFNFRWRSSSYRRCALRYKSSEFEELNIKAFCFSPNGFGICHHHTVGRKTQLCVLSCISHVCTFLSF